MADDLTAVALAAHGAGLCVIPPTQDGKKRPMVPWRRYEHERPTEDRLRRWYGAGLTGVGVVCGPVSGNLVMLEAETQDMADQLRRVAALFGLADVMARLDAGYLERTPGGGVHWLLRCVELGGNTKLASRPKHPDERRHEHDNRQVLIETREAGGYSVIAPSHGNVHPTGKPYVLLAGGFATIPVVTPEERTSLWRAARDLDELPRVAAPQREPSTRQHEGESVADEFGRRVTWRELLERYGWTFSHTHGERDYWVRPGKTVAEGHSASTIEDGPLYVFSSSTPFEPERGYSKFGAYAVLRHGGNMSEAALTLRAWWKQASA